MARNQTRNGAIIRDFGGLMTDVDPTDIPRGSAQIQTNLASKSVGLLECRAGVRVAAFESTTIVASLTAD